MKPFILCFLLCLIAPVVSAQTWGAYRFVHGEVSIYAERSLDAEIVDSLAIGDEVLADDCREGWCAVYFPFQGNLTKSVTKPRGYVMRGLLHEAQPARVTDPKPAPRRSQACCKICRAGKACGDSCISRSKTCRKGPGCACNG